MLPYILAIAVGLSSFVLSLMAFLAPPLHRKDDFLWGGVGLFYGLVLWLSAGRITGGLLLGQTAGVILVVCFGWQTLRLRWAINNPDKAQTESFSLLVWVKDRFTQKATPKPPVKTEPLQDTPEVAPPETDSTSTEETLPSSTDEISTEAETAPSSTEEVLAEAETPSVATEAPSPAETVEPTTPAPKTDKKGFSLKNLFNFGKSSPKTPSQKSLTEEIAPQKDITEEEADNTTVESETITSLNDPKLELEAEVESTEGEVKQI